MLPPKNVEINKLNFPKSALNIGEVELDIDLHVLDYQSGEPTTLPNDISGYVFIVAANFPSDISDRQIYNGDGILYRLDFRNKEECTNAHLTTTIAKPPCYFADQLTQKDAYKNFGFANAGFARVGKLGARNQLNTAFAVMGDRLFVTFDAGRPYEIDINRMEVLSPVGISSEWRSLLPELISGQMLFPPYQTPAHPAVDPETNDFFTANYSTGLSRLLPAIVRENLCLGIKRWLGGYTDLLYWNGDRESQLQRWRLRLKNGSPVIIEQTLHQIALTEHHLVLIDIAFSSEVSYFLLPGFVYPLLQRIPSKVLRKSIRQFVKSILLRLRKQLPYTNVYIVNREDLHSQNNSGSNLETLVDLNETIPKELEVTKIVLPREVSHFVTDYTDTPDQITLHVAHNNAWDVSEWIQEWDQPSFPMVGIRKDLVGMLVGPVDVSFLGRYTIDPEAGILQDTKVLCDRHATWAISLYTHPPITKASPKVETIYWLAWGFYRDLVPKRIFDAYKNYRYRGISVENFTDSKEECTDKAPCLIKLDTETMKIQDKYSFPSGCFPSSPQFVPKQGASDQDGYIVCTVVSDRKNIKDATDEIWIFETNNLHGPKYRLVHKDLNFGVTIHSTWMQHPERTKESFSEKEAQNIRSNSFDKDYNQLLKDILERDDGVPKEDTLSHKDSIVPDKFSNRLNRQEYKSLPKKFYDALRDCYINQRFNY